MHHLKIKDQKLRSIFRPLELKLKLKKFILINISLFLFKNKNFSAVQKKLIYYQMLKKKKKSLLNKIVRRCVITNRSKSIRFFKISRIQSKELISFGILPGYKKAVW